MGLNGSVSLFSDMGDTLTALNEFVRHFGWKEVTIISEIQEAFLKVRLQYVHKLPYLRLMFFFFYYVIAIESTYYSFLFFRRLVMISSAKQIWIT